MICAWGCFLKVSSFIRYFFQVGTPIPNQMNLFEMSVCITKSLDYEFLVTEVSMAPPANGKTTQNKQTVLDSRINFIFYIFINFLLDLAKLPALRKYSQTSHLINSIQFQIDNFVACYIYTF